MAVHVDIIQRTVPSVCAVGHRVVGETLRITANVFRVRNCPSNHKKE
jgi:hypothetical protein